MPAGRAIGFVGHRDLSRVGGPDGLAGCLDTVFAALRRAHPGATLVTGYAIGADRFAVARWKATGGPTPVLLFPFTATLPDGSPAFLAADREHTTPEDFVSVAEARRIGLPRAVKPEAGVNAHVAQAAEIIRLSAVLVAAHDGRGPTGIGGAGDTIERARRQGLPLVDVTRGADGRWQVDGLSSG